MSISPDIPMHKSPETPGNQLDMQLLLQDNWLLNTEVRYHLHERNSLWHLMMLYIAIENPFKFICKKIDSYNSEKKALTFAKILQRGIRKDARGTLKTNKDAFNLCNN